MKTLFRSLLIAIIASPFLFQPLCAMHSNELSIPSSGCQVNNQTYEDQLFNLDQKFSIAIMQKKDAEFANYLQKAETLLTSSQEPFSLTTTLYAAVSKNDAPLVEKLLDIAKPLPIPEKIQEICLKQAIKNNNHMMLNSFMTYSGLNPQSLLGGKDTLLTYAVRHKADDVLQEVLIPLCSNTELDYALSLLIQKGKSRQKARQSSLSDSDSDSDNDNDSDPASISTQDSSPSNAALSATPTHNNSSLLNWGIGTAAVGTVAAIVARYILKK